MTTLADLGLDADLRRQPWRYPGPPLPHPVLQLGEVLAPLSWRDGECLVEREGSAPTTLDEALREHAAPVLADRTGVLAVGSNRSVGTLLTKFAAASVSTVIPSVPVTVRGIAAGFSAHVSVPGFIAAAPFRASVASLRGVISTLDDRQLACLDATEPNYVRTCVDAEIDDEAARLFLTEGVVQLYVSVHGVVGDERRRPLPFTDQAGVLHALTRLGLLPPSLLAQGVPAAVAALHADPALRELLRRKLSVVSVPSGFGVEPAVRTPGS